MKPMLAYTIKDTDKLSYPQMVSAKLDGVRAIVMDGVVYSRSMKPIRSATVQEKFGKAEYNGLDGELIYGPPTSEYVFNVTTRAVMSSSLPNGFVQEELRFFIFDHCLSEATAMERYHLLTPFAGSEGVVVLPQSIITSAEQLGEQECLRLEQGYEGVMCKDPKGLYKQGRATSNGGEIGKLKRFSDEEAVVIGMTEKMQNTNDVRINELGRSQRPQNSCGLVGTGELGSLVVHSDKWGVFNIGSGFNIAQRQEIWQDASTLGKLAKFKFFELGCIDKPRFPIFLGFRDADDIS